MDLNVLIAGLGILGSVLAGLWRVYSSLGTKIDDVFVRLESNKEEILDKLLYHERHDDQRFTDISNNLWAVRLEYAQDKRSQGQNPTYPPFPNRAIGRPKDPEGTV